MAHVAGKPKRAGVPLVEVLIGAVRAGGGRLSRVRFEFERMDAAAGVKRLVLQAVDPELLAAVVGPRLVPVWVDPLRAQYARFKQAYPADWVDVEKVWREQRARWRRREGTAASAAAGSQAAARPYPARDGRRRGRAATPRPDAARRPARPVPGGAPVHRPVPAGAPVPHDPDVELVAGPPDALPDSDACLVGVSPGEAVPDAVSAAGEADCAAGVAQDARKPAAAARAASAVTASPGDGVNGAPVDPPVSPRSAAAERVLAAPRGSAGDAGIVLSGRAGELVARLLEAMADSRARVESVRRVWIDAEGAAGGWDLWALDPAVIDRARALQRAVER